MIRTMTAAEVSSTYRLPLGRELSVWAAIMVKTPATVSPAPGHGRLDWSRHAEA